MNKNQKTWLVLLGLFLCASFILLMTMPVRSPPKSNEPITSRIDIPTAQEARRVEGISAKSEVEQYFLQQENEYVPPPNDGWVADWGLWSDLSEQEARKLYLSIPMELALTYSFGANPKNEMVIFTDPYNQNDRRLYRLIIDASKKMNAVVHVFLLPGKTEIGNVDRILCSINPKKSWWDWMEQISPTAIAAVSLFPPRINISNEAENWKSWQETHPQNGSCQASRSLAIHEFASNLGVSHTPTVIFANGRAWPSPAIQWTDIESNWKYVASMELKN